jgi:thioredoxin-related protein
MTFVYISEQTELIFTEREYLFVFLTETECVYCAILTESLNMYKSS